MTKQHFNFQISDKQVPIVKALLTGVMAESQTERDRAFDTAARLASHLTVDEIDRCKEIVDDFIDFHNLWIDEGGAA